MIDACDFDPLGLPAIRKLLRVTPDLGDYCIYPGIHYGAADFEAMEAALVADGCNHIFVPPDGNYLWDEMIVSKRGVVYEGAHKSASVFKFYHTDDGMRVTGELATGGGLRRLSIVKGNSGECVSFVRLLASQSGSAPDYFEIDGCNFTSTAKGVAQYSVLLDGNARDGSAPNNLVGLRDIRLTDTDVFNASYMTIEARACKALSLSRVNVFKADGLYQRMNISGVNSAMKSTNVHLSHCAINQLIIDRAQVVIASDNYFEDVTITANASSCRVGTAFGTVSNASPSSKVTN